MPANCHTCYKKNRPPLSEKPKKLVRFYKMYKFENSACHGPNQQTRAGGQTCFCPQVSAHKREERTPLRCWLSVRITWIQTVSVIRSAAAQQRGQSRRHSGCRWADSLRQPVERAEGLRDEGQESPARIPPVLPVWGGVLQERVGLVWSARPPTARSEPG